MKSPDKIVEDRELYELCMNAIRRIDQGQSETALDYIDGCGFREIASRRNIPLPTAKSRMRLARTKVRQIVGVS